MGPNPQETADLVTCSEEIRNRKLHFLCRVCWNAFPKSYMRSSQYTPFSNHVWCGYCIIHYSYLVKKLGYVAGKNWYRKFDLQINLILARSFLNTDCCITFSPFFIKFLTFRSLLSKFSGATYFCVAFVLI